MAHSLRTLGSAALNIALLAQGAIDVFWYVLRRRVVHGRSPLYFIPLISWTDP